MEKTAVNDEKASEVKKNGFNKFINAALILGSVIGINADSQLSDEVKFIYYDQLCDQLINLVVESENKKKALESLNLVCEEAKRYVIEKFGEDKEMLHFIDHFVATAVAAV